MGLPLHPGLGASLTVQQSRGLLGVSGPLVLTFPPVNGGPELTVGCISTADARLAGIPGRTRFLG